MKILSFGEILFDVFESTSIIGGAPFNFSAHVKKLGTEAALISAVGRDALGSRALAEIRKYGIDDAYVAQSDYPTGRCVVTLTQGTPSYEIVKDTAFDFIPFPENPQPADAFYFGTLAARSAVSRNTLFRLLDSLRVREVFFDINIRQNFYSNEVLDKGLCNATILKISREEMGVFGNYQVETLCAYLTDGHPNIKYILLTLDKDGAYLYDAGQKSGLYSKKPQSKVVSTVGAGDSFSACFMHHYLNGVPVENCLERAIDLSDYVVTKLEAIPD